MHTKKSRTREEKKRHQQQTKRANAWKMTNQGGNNGNIHEVVEQIDSKKSVTMFSLVVVCDSIRKQEKQVVNEVNFVSTSDRLIYALQKY